MNNTVANKQLWCLFIVQYLYRRSFITQNVTRLSNLKCKHRVAWNEPFSLFGASTPPSFFIADIKLLIDISTLFKYIFRDDVSRPMGWLVRSKWPWKKLHIFQILSKSHKIRGCKEFKGRVSTFITVTYFNLQSSTVVPPNSRLIGSKKNPAIRKSGN